MHLFRKTGAERKEWIRRVFQNLRAQELARAPPCYGLDPHEPPKIKKVEK